MFVNCSGSIRKPPLAEAQTALGKQKKIRSVDVMCNDVSLRYGDLVAIRHLEFA